MCVPRGGYSAGVGRTGTFILLDYMVEAARSQQPIDILSYIRRLRTARNYMVQSLEQLVFSYRLAIDVLNILSTRPPPGTGWQLAFTPIPINAPDVPLSAAPAGIINGAAVVSVHTSHTGVDECALRRFVQ